MPTPTLARPTETIRNEAVEVQCSHHWLIDPPVEAVSKGICKLCGAQKVFNNFLFADVRNQQEHPGVMNG